MENKKEIKCEFCGKEHDGSFGSGRFCSSNCSRKYSSNFNKEKRLKNISKSISGKFKEESIEKYTKISDQEFIDIINRSKTWKDIYTAMDIPVVSFNKYIKDEVISRCEKLGISIKFSGEYNKIRDTKTDWSEQDVSIAVKNSLSYAEALRRLGFSGNRGNNIKTLKKKIKEYNIDTSHFLGRSRYSLEKALKSSDEDFFRNGVYHNGDSLKKRLFNNNLKEKKCECCGLTEWNGNPIPLQVHHIDGNNLNNSLDNLQILCPNCHAQTDNYCRKNKRA